MALVIIVHFTIRPGCEAPFLTLMQDNAAKSVALEPGCHRFDVAASDDQRQVFLYEVYEDGAAFDHHLVAAHYLAFDRASREMVLEKTVQRFTLLAGNP